MKKYLVLTGHAKTGTIYGKTERDDDSQMMHLETLEEAQFLKSIAKKKWLHMIFWIVELDFDTEKATVKDDPKRLTCGCLETEYMLCPHGNSPLA